MPPNPRELKQFMDALAQVESSDNYRAVGEDRGSSLGVAQGRYQIMSKNVENWGREFGYSDLTVGQFLSNPQIQDEITARKMSQYYDAYGGDWSLVAAAWFGGPGAANTIVKQGLSAAAGINDDGNKPGRGINVPTYIQRVIANMGKTGSGTSRVQTDGRRVTPQQAVQQSTNLAASPRRRVAQSVMNRLSETVKSNPDSPETHTMMKNAMQSLFGRDAPTGGTQGVADTPVFAASGQPREAPSPTEPPPTEAPGLGQSGVR